MVIFKWTRVHSALDTFAFHLRAPTESICDARLSVSESDCAAWAQINCGAESAIVILLREQHASLYRANAFLFSIYITVCSLPSRSAIYQCRVIAHITLSSAKVVGLVQAASAHALGSSRWKVCSPARNRCAHSFLPAPATSSHPAAVYKLGMKPPPLSACDIYGDPKIRRATQ